MIQFTAPSIIQLKAKKLKPDAHSLFIKILSNFFVELVHWCTFPTHKYKLPRRT